jgi:CheY-like chemotaxis protein
VIGYEGPRKTVLVADDVAENRALLVDYLRPLGFFVSEAADGADAVAQARSLRPDLIVMDNVMPVMTGLDATRRMRDDPTVSGVPIIAVSASASQNDRDRSHAAGVDAFLHKPIDLGELLRQMAALLRLEWTWRDDTPAVPPRPLMAPPPDQLQALHHLAMMGNMREIRRHAAMLIAMDTQLRPFAEKLDLLARGYQSSAIRRFVEQYL